MVRVGLVRCWNCNAFMRDDIAERYQQLTASPQKIVFSDVAEEQRTALIGPRPELAAFSAKAGVKTDPAGTEFSVGREVVDRTGAPGAAAVASQNPEPASAKNVDPPAAAERSAAAAGVPGNLRKAATAESAAAAAPPAASADEAL